MLFRTARARWSVTVSVLVFVLMTGAGLAYAALPYAPGQTLDPTCHPGESNCTVQVFTAAGDLSGSSTRQTVIGLQGNPVASTTPTSSQVLQWNGSAWAPATLSTATSTNYWSPTSTGIYYNASGSVAVGNTVLGTPIATPSPDATKTQWYVKTGGAWCQQTPGAVETCISAGGSGDVLGGTTLTSGDVGKIPVITAAGTVGPSSINNGAILTGSAISAMGAYGNATNGYKTHSIAVVGNIAYTVNYLDSGKESTNPALVIYDVTNPAAPSVIGTYTNATNGYHSESIVVVGTLAYVVNFLAGGAESTHPALVIYDVSIPATPTVVGTYSNATNGFGSQNISVVGGRAYVLNYLFAGQEATYPSLVIYNVSIPATPSVLGTYTNATNGLESNSLFVSGSRVYVVNALSGGDELTHSALVVFDVSTPSAPSVLGTYSNAINGFSSYNIVVRGTLAYVVNYLCCGQQNTYPALVIFDVSIPASISVVGTASVDPINGYGGFVIALQGSRAYVMTDLGSPTEAATYPVLLIYDVSNPASPSVLGAYTDAVNGYAALSMNIANNRAYVVNYLGSGDEALYPSLVIYSLGSQDSLNTKAPQPLAFFSAAGTPLPTCAAATLLQRLGVTDAAVATPGSAYTGSGTFTITVQCTFNSSGAVYVWQID